MSISLAGLSKADRLTLLGALALLTLGFIFVIMHMVPVQATVGGARYQASPVGLKPPGPRANQASFFTAQLTLDIPGKPVGQEITFQKVWILDAKGRVKGSAEIIQASQNLKTEIRTPDGRTTISITPQPVKRVLRLFPFESGQVTIQFTTARNLRISRGQVLRARVEGRAGIRKFAATGVLRPFSVGIPQSPPPDQRVPNVPPLQPPG